MKKLLLVLALITLFSCGSSDDNSSSTGSGNLTFNDIEYSFDKIYVVKFQSSYGIYVTKGSISFDFTNPNALENTYSSDFKRLVGFTVSSSSSSLNGGTYGFPIIQTDQLLVDDIILFRDDYQIENGQETYYNTVFNYTDNTSTQSRVVITKFDNDKYAFDFNVITTAGVLTGTYTGTIIKTNY